MFRKTTLKNDLRIVTQRIEGTQAATVLVLVGAGSRYETKDKNGISHFLEHMFFKGAKKYPTARAVAEKIDSIGGDFNAFTGKEYAGYYVKAASENVSIIMDVLSDMLLFARFDTVEIDKERGVIMQEYNMYQDTPMYQVGWNFERLLFGDQPMGWDEVGTKEFIAGVTHADFVKYRDELYMPDNTVISVAGKVDHKEVVELVEKYFTMSSGKKAYNFKSLKPNRSSERVSLVEKKTEQAHMVIGFPSYPESHPDHHVLKVLAVVLGGNMSSRMFQAVREAKGLTYYISSQTDDYQDIGVFSTRAGVDLDRIDLAIEAVNQEYCTISEKEVSEAEFKKAKQFIKGKMTLRLEDSEEYAHLLGKQELLQGKIMSFQDICAAVDKVTSQDLLRVAQDIYLQEKMHAAVIGPFNDKKRFEKLLKLGS